MLDLLGLRDDAFAEGIFARCGVERRHLDLSPALFETSLQARTPDTEEGLFRMAAEASERLDLTRPRWVW